MIFLDCYVAVVTYIVNSTKEMGGHPLFFPCLLFIKLNKTLRELPLISRVSRKKNMFIQGGKYIFNLNLCSAQMSSVTNHTFRSLLQVMVFD